MHNNKTEDVKFFVVGGAVRDALLRKEGKHIPTGDRDWVVTGATPQWMFDHGFISVGADFPVFLHPQTHEEYALARTERKTARGYHGFQFYASPDVSLEDDLRRRDLTINAMARSSDGVLIDPWGGQSDLRARILRHVSPAFAEDPVRILRLARFAAKFPEFSVAPETMRLARRMVNEGEVDALVAERVWKEISRGLCEKSPVRMIDVLEECGFWHRCLAGVPVDEEKKKSLERAATDGLGLDVRAALLFAKAQPAAKQVLETLRAGKQTISLADLFEREQAAARSARTAADFASLFEKCDCLRRPQRFEDFLNALHAAHPACGKEQFLVLAQAWRSVDAGAVVRKLEKKGDIASAIRLERLSALQALLVEGPCSLNVPLQQPADQVGPQNNENRTGQRNADAAASDREVDVSGQPAEPKL